MNKLTVFNRFLANSRAIQVDLFSCASSINDLGDGVEFVGKSGLSGEQ